LTIIQKEFQGDAFFPEFSLNDVTVTSEVTVTLPPLPYTFSIFERAH